MGKPSNKVVLITGAGSGAGRAMAVALAMRGARIVVNDINADLAAETAAQVTAAGGLALEYVADISKKFSVQAMFNEIEDAWGPPNILINNARVVPQKPLLDMDEWDWRRTLDVNLTGVFIMMQVAGRVMRARGDGLIINVIQAPEEAAGLGAYLASIAGVRALTEAARGELADDKVSVALVDWGGDDALEKLLQLAE